MSTKAPDATAPSASRGTPDTAALGLLRVVAGIAVVAGAVASLAFMLRAGQHTPRFLLVLFIIWMLSPFAALAWANMVSKSWALLTRATLYVVTLVVTLGTLAIYGAVVSLKPAGSPNAFLWVIGPPTSCVVITMVVSIAALMSRRPSVRR